MENEKMENMKFCQSCGMPLTRPEDYGTNADGSKNEDYCQYCYREGKFLQEVSMDEMIENCVPFVSEGNPYSNADEARKAMMEFFPTLKRWKQA